MVFFTELEQKISQLVWKHKSNLKSKAILRKKKGGGGTNLSDFRLYYKATSHEYSMILAQKQKYRPVVQDRKPRDKPMQLWARYV